MKKSYRQSLGRLGESLAANFLAEQGYTILERNIHTPYGEIDLVARMGDTVIFVEVKTRASKSLGPPEIAITSHKQEHMRSAAEYYIQQHPDLQNDYRIDLVTVQKEPGNLKAMIDHFENVIS